MKTIPDKKKNKKIKLKFKISNRRFLKGIKKNMRKIQDAKRISGELEVRENNKELEAKVIDLERPRNSGYIDPKFVRGEKEVPVVEEKIDGDIDQKDMMKFSSEDVKNIKYQMNPDDYDIFNRNRLSKQKYGW